jgi:DNA mismatch repair protein MutL
LIFRYGDYSFIINGGAVIRNRLTEREIFEQFIDNYKDTGETLTQGNREKIACSLALANASGYGNRLTAFEMRVLVDNLFACGNPNYSPSGKPVLSIIPIEELEKRFYFLEKTDIAKALN